MPVRTERIVAFLAGSKVAQSVAALAPGPAAPAVE
jgi:hypothetical protein